MLHPKTISLSSLLQRYSRVCSALYMNLISILKEYTLITKGIYMRQLENMSLLYLVHPRGISFLCTQKQELHLEQPLHTENRLGNT